MFKEDCRLKIYYYNKLLIQNLHHHHRFSNAFSISPNPPYDYFSNYLQQQSSFSFKCQSFFQIISFTSQVKSILLIQIILTNYKKSIKKYQIMEKQEQCVANKEQNTSHHDFVAESRQQKQDKQDKIQSQTTQQQQIDMQYEQETPEHFYDSDIASVNEKDFLSDNEPPKDIALERKLLFKEKLLHVYKTIISLGYGIDKPARYDLISLKWKKLQTLDPKSQIKMNNQSACGILEKVEEISYNLGIENEDIERMVTSMRPKQVAFFEVECLQIGDKNSVKLLKERTSFVIGVRDWTTVIDIQGNKRFLKYILKKGNGPNRVSQHDQVSFSYEITHNNRKIRKELKQIRLQNQIIQSFPITLWKILGSMKKQETSTLTLSNEIFREIQSQEKIAKLEKIFQEESIQENTQKVADHNSWKFQVQVADYIKVDDVDLNGGLLKKTILRGVSTAKPDSSSIIYFSLKFIGPNGQILKEDNCFNSDWWQDYGKLDLIGCRKVFLDQWKVSKALKRVFYRMKPAQIAEMQVRDLSLFTFGQDYDQLKELYQIHGFQFPPKAVDICVRVYNFTEGKTCFNMELQQKIEQSKRKKALALKIFEQKDYQKAQRRFQNIVGFYTQGKINQEGYNQKVSALMNSILCHMKLGQYKQMIPLCDQVLRKPKHGTQVSDITIHGPQNLKIQNKKDPQQDTTDKSKQQSEETEQGKKTFNYLKGEKKDEEDIGVQVNQKTIDKCLYRKAIALSKTGEHQQALQTLEKIIQKNQDIETLKKEINKSIVEYVKKSKEIFKNMFAAFK